MRVKSVRYAIPIVLGVVLVGGAVPAQAAAPSQVPGQPARVAAPAAYAEQDVTWGSCAFEQAPGAPATECAKVTVPRDWANPDAGVDLSVWISRVKASGAAKDRKGALFTNPGGPGGQGSSLAPLIAGLQPAIGEVYDVIGMDPRGTGQEGADNGYTCKVPADRLPNNPAADARDRSAASIAEHQQTPRAVAEACQSDAVAPYVTTWQTTHDMDLIRQLLEEEKLNYLGYSYGSWLGAKYASQFPDQAGRIILDSNVNWQGRLQADFEDWPLINQRQFDDQYLPWALRIAPDGPLGSTPEEAKAVWEKVRTWYAGQGLAPDSYDQIFVGQGRDLSWLLSFLVFYAGAESVAEEDTVTRTASEQNWPEETRAALDRVSRDEFGVGLAALDGETIARSIGSAPEDYLEIPGTRYSVACGDQPTRSAEWHKQLSDRQGPRMPLYGWAYGLSEPCGFWTDEPRQELPNLGADVADNVLMVQGEFDPQTGYEQALGAWDEAPGVAMVSVDDAAYHGQYALQANSCVDHLVNSFLLYDARPTDAVCEGTPLILEDEVVPVEGPLVNTPHAKIRPRNATVGAVDNPLRVALRAKIAHSNRPPTSR